MFDSNNHTKNIFFCPNERKINDLIQFNAFLFFVFFLCFMNVTQLVVFCAYFIINIYINKRQKYKKLNKKRRIRLLVKVLACTCLSACCSFFIYWSCFSIHWKIKEIYMPFPLILKLRKNIVFNQCEQNLS